MNLTSYSLPVAKFHQDSTFEFMPINRTPVPEVIDPVFAKTSQKRSFCMTENERFGLVFVKTGSINSGTGSRGFCAHEGGGKKNFCRLYFETIQFANFFN